MVVGGAAELSDDVPRPLPLAGERGHAKCHRPEEAERGKDLREGAQYGECFGEPVRVTGERREVLVSYERELA